MVQSSSKAPLPLAEACRPGVVPRFVEQQVAAKVLSVTHGPSPVGNRPLRNLGAVLGNTPSSEPVISSVLQTENLAGATKPKALALWTRLRKDVL